MLVVLHPEREGRPRLPGRPLRFHSACAMRCTVLTLTASFRSRPAELISAPAGSEHRNSRADVCLAPQAAQERTLRKVRGCHFLDPCAAANNLLIRSSRLRGPARSIASSQHSFAPEFPRASIERAEHKTSDGERHEFSQETEGTTEDRPRTMRQMQQASRTAETERQKWRIRHMPHPKSSPTKMHVLSRRQS